VTSVLYILSPFVETNRKTLSHYTGCFMMTRCSVARPWRVLLVPIFGYRY